MRKVPFLTRLNAIPPTFGARMTLCDGMASFQDALRDNLMSGGAATRSEAFRKECLGVDLRLGLEHSRRPHECQRDGLHGLLGFVNDPDIDEAALPRDPRQAIERSRKFEFSITPHNGQALAR